MVALFFLPKIVVHKEQDGAEGRPSGKELLERRRPTRLRGRQVFCEFETELCVTLRPWTFSSLREFKTHGVLADDLAFDLMLQTFCPVSSEEAGTERCEHCSLERR